MAWIRPVFASVLACLAVSSAVSCGQKQDETAPLPASRVGEVVTPTSNSLAAISPCSSIPAGGERWSAKPLVREARKPVFELVERSFGPDAKSDGQLRAGLIGVVPDNALRELVVVIDPTLVENAQALQSELREAGRSSHRTDAELPVVPVRVQASCLDSEDLIDARAVIQAQEWHPAAKGSVAGYGLTPRSSSYKVILRDVDDVREIGAALERQLHRAVDIEYP